MAQPRRVLILRAQPQSLDQHQLHLRRRTRNPDRLLGLPLKRQPRALRLDQTRRRDPRQSRPRTSHPRPDHQIRDTPLGPARPGEPRSPCWLGSQEDLDEDADSEGLGESRGTPCGDRQLRAFVTLPGPLAGAAAPRSPARPRASPGVPASLAWFGGKTEGRPTYPVGVCNPSSELCLRRSAVVWQRQDSNLCRQCRRFYRPLPLAARAPCRLARMIAMGGVGAQAGWEVGLGGGVRGGGLLAFPGLEWPGVRLKGGREWRTRRLT